MQPCKSIPSDGLIAVDLPCFDCQYDLRMLRAGGQCPECGTAIAETLRRNLIGADPAWLQGVRMGAIQLGWAFVLFAAWMGVGLIIAFCFPTERGLLENVVSVACVFLVFMLAIVGAMRFARRDPRSMSTISIVRWGTVACGVAALGSLWLPRFGIQSAVLSGWSFALLCAAWPFFASWHARALSRGAPQSRVFLFAFPVVAVNSLTLLGSAWTIATERPLLPDAAAAVIRRASPQLAQSLGLALPLLVLMPWFAFGLTGVLLLHLARALSRVREKAEALRAGFERGAEPART